jgi:hypothetical protein
MGLPIIGKMLGHTQAATTARYAHLASDPVKAAAAAGRRQDRRGDGRRFRRCREGRGASAAAALGRIAFVWSSFRCRPIPLNHPRHLGTHLPLMREPLLHVFLRSRAGKLLR